MLSKGKGVFPLINRVTHNSVVVVVVVVCVCVCVCARAPHYCMDIYQLALWVSMYMHVHIHTLVLVCVLLQGLELRKALSQVEGREEKPLEHVRSADIELYYYELMWSLIAWVRFDTVLG